ncbi:MAG: hypothetical protein ACOCSM_03605 [Bacillota bacterium]
MATIDCPSCGYENDEFNTKCRQCGTRLDQGIRPGVSNNKNKSYKSFMSGSDPAPMEKPSSGWRGIDSGITDPSNEMWLEILRIGSIVFVVLLFIGSFIALISRTILFREFLYLVLLIMFIYIGFMLSLNLLFNVQAIKTGINRQNRKLDRLIEAQKKNES